MSDRIKPEEVFSYDFERFEEWADKNDIGTTKEDWIIWWECWKDGYYYGREI